MPRFPRRRATALPSAARVYHQELARDLDATDLAPNLPVGEAGVGQCPIGYATVEVRTAGGLIWTYGSVVDNGTGDPTTILPFVE